MLRELAAEALLVLFLTTFLLVLAATLGLPGRPENPEVEAAEEPAPSIDRFEFEHRLLFEPRR